MSSLPDLFPGFRSETIVHDGLDFFVRVGGAGPALLCLHGYPQTHACWHRMAQALAEKFTVVAMDMRGYGRSAAPPGDAEHLTYSKRAMANDCIGVMRSLGFDKFHVMGHDRGARVGYRLALDHPGAIDRLVILDIIPTVEAFDRMRADSAHKSYHWLFLSQPRPLPETMITANPEYYLDYTLGDWAGARGQSGLGKLSPDALEHYRALLRDPARVHAVCEDYRSGIFVDRPLDAADREAGRRLACPTLVLWGSEYLGKGAVGPLDVWKEWCVDVRGQEIRSGHFLAEENPDETLAAVLPFLDGAG
jgi:haloacetate dehalogenase